MAISDGSQPSYYLLPEINDEDKTTGDRYLGGLVFVAETIPLFFVAALLTLIIHFWLMPEHVPGNVVIILGLISTLILWLLLALPCMRFASAKGGRPSDYDLLKTEYTALENRLQHIADQGTQEAGKAAAHTEQDEEHQRAREIACGDVQSELGDFVTTLKRNGLNWVLYTGYVSMWDRLNKADEAMVDLLPPETTIEAAMSDKLRLDGSKVPKKEDLINALDIDIAALNPNEETTGKLKKKTKEEAISDIRNTRSTINKYNNERWGQLVRARNRLLGTAFLAAIFIYIPLVLALLYHVLDSFPNAIVFYFVGAIVGLFYRLYNEWSAKDPVTAEDDYGLTTARVLVTPLLSGLAALVGVLLLTSTTGGLYSFTFENLVFAAALGYAPNIVIDKLSAKQKEIQGQIHSTSVADRQDTASEKSGTKNNGSAGSPS